MTHDTGSESTRERSSGLLPIESPRSQVKQGGFVELSDRRAVAALDLVGVDLQFRLGIDLCTVAQQQVVIGLLGIGAVRTSLHQRLAVPDATTAAGEDAAVFLYRARGPDAVVDADVVVDVLPVIGDIQAADERSRVLACDIDVEVVPDQAAAQVKPAVTDRARCVEPNGRSVGLGVVPVSALYAHIVRGGPSPERQFDDAVGIMIRVADRRVVFDELRLRAFFEFYLDARLGDTRL